MKKILGWIILFIILLAFIYPTVKNPTVIVIALISTIIGCGIILLALKAIEWVVEE
jgi:hypothetical protein